VCNTLERKKKNDVLGVTMGIKTFIT